MEEIIAQEEIVIDKTVEWEQLLKQAFSELHQAKEAMGDQALKQVSLLGCIALKTAMAKEAQACFEELLNLEEGKVSAEGYLTCVKNMLMMAARMRKGELFNQWIASAEEKMSASLLKVEQPKAVDFIIAITFVVCDRRYGPSLPIIENMAGKLIEAIVDKELLQKLFNEWTSLIAQIARRNWSDVNEALFSVLFKALLAKEDLQLLKHTLLLLNMHLQMYTRWDGFENAFVAYKELQYFYLLLLQRAVDAQYEEEVRKQYLVTALRYVREWIANVARISMKDELEIIRQWQELLKANAPENLQELTDILVQLEILYWNQTKPKTSRKQLEYLMDLLEPNKISEVYYSLYKQIVWKA